MATKMAQEQSSAPEGAGEGFDYVIIGAGPAGLATASFLKQQGFRIAVFEGRGRPDNPYGSYPVVLNRRGLSALEALDGKVAARTQETGYALTDIVIIPDNKVVAQRPVAGTCIMRDQAAWILLEHAEALGVRLFWDHKLEALDLERRTCTFAAPSGDVSVHAPQLVACDGNRSKVRRICEEKLPFKPEVADWGFRLRFMTVPSGAEGCDDAGLDPAAHFVLGDKGYVCKQPNGVWSISLGLPDDAPDFLTADEPSDERIAQLKAYVADCSTISARLLNDEAYRGWFDCAAYGGVTVKLPKLNPTDWIVLCGDAAHAVQPATGEGINSGLEDAMLLARCVAEGADGAFERFNALHLADNHALNNFAMQAKDLVVGDPRTKATALITTIGLGIAKKLRIIDGSRQDYCSGELALTQGVKSYAELLAMEDRQTAWLKPIARGLATIARVPKVTPSTGYAEAQPVASRVAK